MNTPALLPIRVAPGGCYFETTDGQPFLFIGANDALSWPGLLGLYRRRNLDAVDAYLDTLARSGVTILRLMLEYAHDDRFLFERPTGRFNPVLVQIWDDLFARCERFGLRVLLTPWDTFWMARRWHRHPYNAANGGPASAPAALLTDPATIDALLLRLRFVAERWGGSGALAAWDLFNELHPHWGGTPAEQSAVIARFSAAVRATEQRAWGFTRPQTVSIYGPDPDPDYSALVFEHPDLDFATTHIYEADTIDHPQDTVTPACAMARWVRQGRQRTRPGRPFTDSEHGPIHLFNDHRKMLPEGFDDEYERHLMWAHLASGGAGSGLRWPARHPHILTSGARLALASLSAFATQIDWRTFAPDDASARLHIAADELLCFGCADTRQAVLWLLRGAPDANPPGVLPDRAPLVHVPLALAGMAAGGYRVALWDTRAGCSAGELTAQVGTDGTLRVVLPQVRADLAIAVRAC